MEIIGIRRYHIDNLKINAEAIIELISESNEKYYTKLYCSENEIQGMRKDDLFRFFNKDPKDTLVHETLKEMVIQEKKLVMSTDVNDICFMIALVIMVLAFFVILGLCFHKFMKDDVKSHYRLVKQKTSNDKVINSFIIKSPSNEGEI